MEGAGARAGEKVEFGGDCHGGSGGGSSGADASAERESEGVQRIIGTIRSAERWTGIKGGSEVKPELTSIASRETREERQAEDADRDLSTHQGLLILSKLERRLHG